MEVQTYTETQQQEIFAPYGTVKKSKSGFKWKSDYVTPMELGRLLWNTEARHQNLTIVERAILSVMLYHVNLTKADRKGLYEAYPSAVTITAHLNVSERSFRDHKKFLEKNNWITIHSGTGQGRNNHYYINARKIVNCYKLSHPEDDKRYLTGDGFDAIESIPFPIKRNTSRLKQGRGKCRSAQTPVQ